MSLKDHTAFRFLIITLVFFYVSGSNFICAQSLKYSTRLFQNKDWNFVENKGQLTDQSGNPQTEIKYYGHQGGVYLYCKPGMLSFVFTKIQKNDSVKVSGISSLQVFGAGVGVQNFEPLLRNKPASEATVTTSRTDLILINANPDAQIIASDQQQYHENFYNVHDSGNDLPGGKTQISNVQAFKKITYKDIYPHIDMVLSCQGKGLEYSFVVYPGGKVSDIQMQWNGLDSIRLQAGNNRIHYVNKLGHIEETGLAGRLTTNEPVSCRYLVKGNIISFHEGDYDKNNVLVIDPKIDWGTYFGGDDEDEIWDMKMDREEAILVAGRTFSPSGIATSGGYQTTYGDSGDGFIAKFTNTGEMLWATYFGGSGSDACSALAYDEADNIYVTGGTGSRAGIATSGAYQTSGGMFLEKFDSAGKRIWGTYYGGNSAINPNTVSTDTVGNVYIGGTTLARTGIATSGAFQTKYSSIGFMGFVAKFNTLGSLQWGTYFGGNRDDEIQNLTTDLYGNVFFTGVTIDTVGIATKGSFQAKLGGSADAFLGKFNSNGALQWATYFGDTGSENGTGLAVDTIGNVYLYGNTSSRKGIATSGTYQTIYGGGVNGGQPIGDAFIAEFNTNGNKGWSTYFGGPGNEGATGICYNPLGRLDITGLTNSQTGISSLNAYQYDYGGGLSDAFLAEFTLDGNLLSGTYYGGSDQDYVSAVAVDKEGDAYIAGYTYSYNDIATPGSYQSTAPGGDNGFIAGFNLKYLNDAGLSSFTSPGNMLCAGKYPVIVSIRNYGDSTLDSVRINWTINGKLQNQYNWKGNLKSAGATIIVLDNDSFSAGIYLIKVWTSFPNGLKDSVPENDTVSSEIRVSSYPDPHFCLVSDSPVSVFKAIDSTEQYYHWSFGDGSTGDNYLVSHKYPFNKDSIVDVSLTVSTAFGCSKTFDSTVKIRYIPSYNFYVQVFPNPFNQNINIKISLEKSSRIEIMAYDDIGRLIGKLIDTEQPGGIANYSFDTEKYNLAYGIYYLKILVDGKPYTMPVVRAE